MEFLASAFDALKPYRQFIVYALVPSKKRIGKNDKLPIDYRTGHIAAKGINDIEAWTDADTAITAARRFGASYGIGFVLTAQDPFFFLDIDNCLDTASNTWSKLATDLINALPGAAVEVSSSQKGLHIIGSGVAPQHSCKNEQLNLEFYTSQRFIALTGTHATGSAATDCTPYLVNLVSSYFSSSASRKNTGSIADMWAQQVALGKRSEWNGPTDNNELISRALKSQSLRSTFGTGASFADLWDANVAVLAAAYPRALGYNESRADAALAQHLAFWTGNDCERMHALMLQSKLLRDKWKREDYLFRTILTACNQQTEWLCDKVIDSPVTPATDATATPNNTIRPTPINGATFATVQQQFEIFEGCAYVMDEHKILIPGGYLLNPDRFRVMYGGLSYQMDLSNQKVTRNAWEAFNESQGFRAPKTHTSCFRPDEKPGSIIKKDGQLLANLWWPVETPRVAGDASPFLNHLKKIIPDERDQIILLSYMAACVQHKGVKFQWAPLLQGVEGNGKTLFTRCVAFAIGDRYTHFPKAAEIAGKFNDWLYQKIFIGVEDIYLIDARHEVMETLKPMITSERQEIEPKGGAKVTRDICANFLINTNHKDGLRKTRNDRRFAPFYTPQQSLADLKRDGMLGDYFPNIYDWLKYKNGYAIVSEFLHTYPILPEFNPAAICKRAPITSSTESAIAHGVGTVEQEITESIEQGIAGFKNGWISSMALDRLLEKLNASRRIPRNKRRELMQSLGYDVHPALHTTEGRVTTVVTPDAGKPRLYIKDTHEHRGLIGAVEVAKAYSDAQK